MSVYPPFMADDYIRKALDQALVDFYANADEEKELARQQWELRKRSFKLLAKIHSLAALCEDIPSNSALAKFTREIENTGLTQAVRNILSGAGEWLTVAQLRDYLIRFRIDIAKYKNPSSSIHTILTRMIDAGEVELKTDPKTKKTLFRRIPPMFVNDDDRTTAEQMAEFLVKPLPRRGGKMKEGAQRKLIAERAESSLKN